METELAAGAATADITPRGPQFLYGYPHTERYSTGVHDPLLSVSLYMSDGSQDALIMANDIIYVSKALCHRVRKRISEATGVPGAHIMLTATHTHSGPMTVDILSNSSDETIPPTDTTNLAFLEERMVESAKEAYRAARRAQVGLAVAHTRHTNTNRHDPTGPADRDIPVLIVRDAMSMRPIACMLVHCLHPTVLHEDSTLISADFPGMVREYLQGHVLGDGCPALYHIGPAGNQSPRHVVADNTFASARALGTDIGKAIQTALLGVEYRERASIRCLSTEFELIPRRLPTKEEASAALKAAWNKYARLKASGASSKQVRTAECDWFGAEETMALAIAAADGRLEQAYAGSQPAEIQAVGIGPWTFVSWPGEIFVEYGLDAKRRNPNTFVISLANGELQGYIATREAVEEGYYEAGNALFDYRNGERFVNLTQDLLAKMAYMADVAAP